MKKNKAFTLAEILLTLAIIGTIAALTMPNLVTGTSEKEAYAKVAKAYSTVSNATKQIEATNGRMRFWDWSTVFRKHYGLMLNTACIGSSCFTDVGSRSDWNGSTKFVTTDGMYWAFTSSSNCGLEKSTYLKNGCAYFEVDINGSKKPNKSGKDIFAFVITKDGTYPFGNCPGCSTADCDTQKGNSLACTAVILNEGKIKINETEETE